MSKKLRATRDFTFPDGPKNFQLAKAGKLEEVTKWANVTAGTILVEPDPALLASWLANDCVEYVVEPPKEG